MTAVTWGHNDKRLFVATGAQVRIRLSFSLQNINSDYLQVHIGWISKKIPSLQLMCRLEIHKTLQDQTQVDFLPIPCRLKNLISSLFTHSIKAGHSAQFEI